MTIPTFLDRVWTPTALYALSTYTLTSLLPTFHSPTPIYAALLASTAYYLTLLHRAYAHEQLVRSLGAHAPSKRTWTPFNIGLIVQAFWYFSHHRNHELWWGFFRKARRWTVEADVLGGRVVFTADEENVKAVLATRFGDFGKGEQFQRVCFAFCFCV